MESINGLPTHVLAVHAPVVLTPLLLLLALVLAVKADWRQRSGFLLAGAALATVVAAALAVLSGRAFDRVVGDRVDTTDHERLAYTALALLTAALVAAVALAVLDRRAAADGPAVGPGPMTNRILSGLVVVLTGAATWWMVLTGDEGARLVWKGVVGAIMPG